MSTTHVKFFTIHGEEESERSHICFSTLKYITPWPEAIRYECAVKVPESQAKFWVHCISLWLPEDRWTIDPSDDWKTITFYLDCKGLNYAKALTYLSFFRYLDEAVGFIANFYEDDWNKETESQSLFTKLIKLHLKKEGLPMDCHTLTDPYYGKPSPDMKE